MLPHHPATWIRHGDITDAANDYRMRTTAPTLVTDGVPALPDLRDELAVLDLSAAAAGAFSVTVVIWGYKPAVSIELAGVLTEIAGTAGWSELGRIIFSGSVADAESHQLQGVTAYTRLAAQATAVVGAPNVWGDFGFSPHHDVAKEG